MNVKGRFANVLVSLMMSFGLIAAHIDPALAFTSCDKANPYPNGAPCPEGTVGMVDLGAACPAGQKAIGAYATGAICFGSPYPGWVPVYTKTCCGAAPVQPFYCPVANPYPNGVSCPAQAVGKVTIGSQCPAGQTQCGVYAAAAACLGWPYPGWVPTYTESCCCGAPEATVPACTTNMECSFLGKCQGTEAIPGTSACQCVSCSSSNASDSGISNNGDSRQGYVVGQGRLADNYVPLNTKNGRRKLIRPGAESHEVQVQRGRENQ